MLSKFTKPSLEVAADAKVLRPHSRIFSVAIAEEDSHFKQWVAMQQPSVTWGRDGSTPSYPIQEYTGHTQLGGIIVAFTTDGERNLVDIESGKPLFSSPRNQDILKSVVQLFPSNQSPYTRYHQAVAITKSGSVYMIRHLSGRYRLRKVCSGKIVKGVTQAKHHEGTLVLITKTDVKQLTIPDDIFTSKDKSTDKAQSEDTIQISQLYKGKVRAVEMSYWRDLPTLYFIVDSKGALLSGAPSAPAEDTEGKAQKTKLARVKGLLGRVCNQEAAATEFLPCMIGNGISPIRSVTAAGDDEYVLAVTDSGELFGTIATSLLHVEVPAVTHCALL